MAKKTLSHHFSIFLSAFCRERLKWCKISSVTGLFTSNLSICLREIHCSNVSRLYTCPSAATTGSRNVCLESSIDGWFEELRRLLIMTTLSVCGSPDNTFEASPNLLIAADKSICAVLEVLSAFDSPKTGGSRPPNLTPSFTLLHPAGLSEVNEEGSLTTCTVRLIRVEAHSFGLASEKGRGSARPTSTLRICSSLEDLCTETNPQENEYRITCAQIHARL